LKFQINSLKIQGYFLLLIIVLGAILRFNNLNWDSNFHLHPDERFLTMVGNAMRTPSSFSQYLNPQTSTFNPANIDYKFFVYGTFPLTLNKLLALFFNNDNYNSFTIQGRFLSAVFDLLTVFLVYKIAGLIAGGKTRLDSTIESKRAPPLQKNIPYFAAFFYAIAVLPIQLSHFFAVDSFLNFFMLGSFYFALRFYVKGGKTPPLQDIILSAVFFGLALACKITAVFILPLNLIFILLYKHQIPNSLPADASHQAMQAGKSQTISNDSNTKRFENLEFRSLFGVWCLMLGIYILVSYFILRLADPYKFQTANFFDLHPSRLFIENLQQLKSWDNPGVWYPPGVQWINKNAFFGLVNLAVLGVGIPYFILITFGIFQVIKKRNLELSIIFGWMVLFFIYQSVQFVKPMRYFIFIYPYLAILAAVGTKCVNSKFKARNSKQIRITKIQNVLKLRILKIVSDFGFRASNFVIVTFVLIWPFMFSSIYLRPHTRVAASEWIYKNIPNNSMILSEYWDDPLPLSVENNYGKQFRGEQLHVFDPDTPEKWQTMNKLLNDADYYILSSNRGWGSIPTVPERYPLMTKFYQNLFDGKTGYEKVTEFTSYPKLEIGNWKLEIKDDWVDESFTVYDHPKVVIFRRMVSSK